MSAYTSRTLVAIFASLFAGSPAAALADSDIRLVDCAGGASIQDAHGKKNPDRALVLVIQGACTQNVDISGDDVELRGEAGASITGAVRILGARRAVVADLKITNPAGDGIFVTDGASATIRGNEINDSSGYGIFVRNASFAIVNDNQMLRNGAVNNTNIDASGIGVSLGSTVRARGNQIAENANTGVEVFDNSVYRSEDDTIAMRNAGPIGRSAVDTFRAGFVDLRNVTVHGHIFVNQQSQLQARNAGAGQSRLEGAISVSQLSLIARRRNSASGRAQFLRRLQCLPVRHQRDAERAVPGPGIRAAPAAASSARAAGLSNRPG